MALSDDLIAIALEAGTEILDIYGGQFAVMIKPDASPVTEADTRAEAVILQGLAAIVPNVPVIAEESVAAGIVPPPADRFFLVDPLDGSKEFISRNGQFTVNIGLIENGLPVLGVVYAPALGRIWWGGREEGAFAADVNAGVLGTPKAIICTPIETQGYRVVASRSHRTAALEAYLQTLDIAECVAAGSSLKFCLLAEGLADLYPRFGRTMEWDTAAGDAILRAAGGDMRTVSGAPFTYGKRGQAHDIDFANPDFIASGILP